MKKEPPWWHPRRCVRTKLARGLVVVKWEPIPVDEWTKDELKRSMRLRREAACRLFVAGASLSVVCERCGYSEDLAKLKITQYLSGVKEMAAFPRPLYERLEWTKRHDSILLRMVRYEQPLERIAGVLMRKLASVELRLKYLRKEKHGKGKLLRAGGV